jgi:hypothetical protein
LSRSRPDPRKNFFDLTIIFLDLGECIRLIVGFFVFNNGFIVGVVRNGLVRRNLTRSSMDKDGGASLISIDGFVLVFLFVDGFFFIGEFFLFPEVLLIVIDELFSLSLELR